MNNEAESINNIQFSEELTEYMNIHTIDLNIDPIETLYNAAKHVSEIVKERLSEIGETENLWSASPEELKTTGMKTEALAIEGLETVMDDEELSTDERTQLNEISEMLDFIETHRTRTRAILFILMERD